MSDTYFSFDIGFGLNSKQNNLDLFSFQSPDILAPHPDLLDFESEIDSSVALFDDDLQTQLLNVDSPDNYNFFRTQPSACGPPSTITSSAESNSYDNRSEALFSNPTSYAPSNYSFNLEFDSLDLNNLSVEPDFGAVPVGISLTPPSQSIDPSVTMGFDQLLGGSSPLLDDMLGQQTFSRHRRSPSYSDYSGIAPSKRADYLNPADMLGLERSINDFVAQTAQQSASDAIPSPEPEDPRKKHKCNVCNRAFARAFNLKTHMATHDAKRDKPHVCHHFPCDKSFSRKHDLGRHLVSIHNDTSLCPNRSVNGKKPAHKSTVGVARGARGWCETCGKGWVGKQIECDCKEEELFR